MASPMRGILRYPRVSNSQLSWRFRFTPLASDQPPANQPEQSRSCNRWVGPPAEPMSRCPKPEPWHDHSARWRLNYARTLCHDVTNLTGPACWRANRDCDQELGFDWCPRYVDDTGPQPAGHGRAGVLIVRNTADVPPCWNADCFPSRDKRRRRSPGIAYACRGGSGQA